MLETRTSQDGSAIRRRRECGRCEQRFTTNEMIDTSLAVVIGSDGHRAPFSRKTLADSLMLAGRSSLNEEVREVITTEALAVLRDRGPTVTSAEIAEAVLSVLAEKDSRTWVRYALVTQQPGSLRDFEQWLLAHHADDEGQPASPGALVQKRSGTIEPFSLQKLERALQHATRGRGVEGSVCRRIARSIQDLTREAADRTGGPVSTVTIGEWAEHELAGYDALSALSYALLFRNLDSTQAVLSELRRLEKSTSQDGIGAK